MNKQVRSKFYNYNFDIKTGFFVRWGKDENDNPVMSPIGPEILDMEISTICGGIGKSIDKKYPCKWCYKSNNQIGNNMSFDTFKSIFHKLPKNLTQIAFGIGDIDGNPDLWKIMEYCKNNDYNNVIPNITINGMGLTKELVERFANLCGAVSVSRYHIPDVCYDAVKKLSDAGLKQTNIHQIFSVETLDSCYELFNDIKNDKRLNGLNAVILLLLKPKGVRNKLHSVNDIEKFKELFLEAQKQKIKIGMDSCSSPFMLKTASDIGQKEIINSIEPCESTLFSIYINCNGQVFPCSFTEGTPGWETGIDMANVSDFFKDVWYSKRITDWRKKLLNSTDNCTLCDVQSECRACPIYDITPCLEKKESLLSIIK